MALTVTRNPNLTRALTPTEAGSEVQKAFGKNWWTGLSPEDCPGFDRARQCLTALPLLNLKICTRQDVLDYFNNTWTLTELLFQSLKTEETFVRPPYHQLRHPLMFYYGHPAVLFINKLRLAGLVTASLDLYLEKVLETGVDEMSWDDLSKNEMKWPTVAAVHDYRKRVYDIVVDLIQTHPDIEKRDGDLQKSPLWALWMGFEHEKIHFETSSVLIRELPVEEVTTPKFWAPLHPSGIGRFPLKPVRGADYGDNPWLSQKGGKVLLGKPSNTESYGWDNEYGRREVQIKDFQFSFHQITNGEYYEFVSCGAYIRDEYWTAEGLEWRKFRNTKRPTFWAAVGPEGSHEYELRTIFEFIPMPWRWPAEVNYHEAQAYCRWKMQQDRSPLHYRLLTEAEFNQLRGRDADPVLQQQSYRGPNQPAKSEINFNFAWSSPAEASAQIEGNVWHWLEDQFNPLENFEVHPLYDDFSSPCFDGKHQMILGGSFISCGHEASRWARFHFRPHFYQHSGFRMAATLDGSVDNESKKLVRSDTYVHPHRQNILDQMTAKADWWKKVDQPMELSPDQLEKLYALTEQRILNFDRAYSQMHPMGTAHDPTLNSVPPNFAIPYQTSRDFPANRGDFNQLTKFIFEEMAPLSQLPGHPGFAAYVAGSGNAISNLGQLMSQTLNPFTGHYMMAPGLVTLEAEALQWFIHLMALPEKTAGGFFTTGSSLASLSALTMARRKLVKGSDFSKLTLYVSDQAHHCLSKVWATLGFPNENIRFIPTTRPDFQMNVEALRKTLTADQKAGLQPLCIVGSAGTTNTGAIDDLTALAEIAAQAKAWYHVDGAYGALFKLSSKASALNGIERADSLVFDLHKALAFSYGTGCLLVRDKADMRFDYPGAKTYMPPSIDEDDLRMDFADISPELSRDYRGLRVWLPIKTWGIGPFVVNLEEKLKLSEWTAQQLPKISGIKPVTLPQLSIQTFTLNLSPDIEKNNEATQKLLERINRRGTLFLSACRLDGQLCIRLCLLSFRLHFDRLEKALAEIPGMIAEIKKEMKL